MRDWSAFESLRLRSGFTVVRVRTTDEPLINAIGREALAQTSIIGGQFTIVIRASLSDEEVSISLYHEVLEAATVAALIAPAAIVMFMRLISSELRDSHTISSASLARES